ncbi:hypothetical protein E2F50_20310 [Rhizobium deserti]|uniref:Uncharacterized protein n=1 Tax=Rhizobium deserti TaxID=2547961 RepID=A0A4R5U9X3_9HYPH|nr:hypothetical protein [Rhizobium deserti]TDK31287.1 hypothetical protein E2F50_20310 [Rhizobium deserti]
MRTNPTTTKGRSTDAVHTVCQGRRPNDYCVPPLFVNDLISQCAAHFLADFVTHSADHLRSVLKCGVRGPGGLVEEVAHWLSQCDDDVSGPDNNLGYWDIEERGPWVYGALEAADIARVVTRHTKGWSYRDFASYGYTVREKAEFDTAIAGMK